MTGLNDCRLIGRIGRPHGHEGALRLEILDGLHTDLKLEEPVFLLIEGKPVPFFMEELNEAAQPPIVLFEDMVSDSQARELTGLEVYAPKNSVEAETEWNSRELIGCRVFNGDSELGPVTDIIQSGLQELLQIDYRGQELLLPLQDELVAHYDAEAKTLVMELPEGLLDL